MGKFRSIKWLFALQAAALFVFVLQPGCFIVQTHYPRAIENDPLLAPVKVTSIKGNLLVLEDGRSVQLEENLDVHERPLQQAIRDSDFRIDLEPPTGTGFQVYAKHRGWICGTPWVALINIPLFPDDIPINRRELIGLATVVRTPDVASLQNQQSDR